MCSFIVTNEDINDLDYVNFYTKFRGPDNTNVIKIDDTTFVHNLLSITGEFTIQPFKSDNIVCVYNGEIYNAFQFGNYKSDGECLIPLYKEFGVDFVKKLDGEFAIALFDLDKDIILVSSDIFATKPVWIAKGDNGKFCISSYKSNADRLGFGNDKLGLSTAKRVPANTTLIFDKNMNQKSSYEICTFDLNQHKDSFDDWSLAFANSINKRCIQNMKEKTFIGLSSGYDSGAIACELIKQKVPYKAYTIIGVENKKILRQRFDYLNKNKCEHQILDSSNKKEAKDHIDRCVEGYHYEICTSRSKYNEFNRTIHTDTGSIGLSMVCIAARKDGRKIYLSGQGADEIFSDYGFNGKSIYHSSNFGGLFPEDLKTIFPWLSFYGSSQRSYMAKEEYVAGSYGIEARYPFLDRAVIQEFLWLTTNRKNKHYKWVLHNLMWVNRFPFAVGAKIGFGI